MDTESARKTDRRVVMAFFREQSQAESALNALVEKDVPLDRASILGRVSSSGDDPLGVYYVNVGERTKGWGKMGAFWGGLWGLLTGAAVLDSPYSYDRPRAPGPHQHSAVVGLCQLARL